MIGYNGSWSRDGSLIFDGSPFKNDEIATIDPSGHDLRVLTSNVNAADIEPMWSPDGRRIVFVSDRTEDDEIWVMNADGSGQRNLSRSKGSDYVPFWSPDGSRIAFTSDRGDDPEVYVMNADGTDQVDVTRSPGIDLGPAWSPDGTKIAYVHFDPGSDFSSIYVMSPDGSNRRRLTDGAASTSNDIEPMWSPDGSKIVFTSDRDDDYAVFVMNADGSGLHRLIDDGHEDGEPFYSPDGTLVAYDRFSEDRVELFVANADGSNPRRVTTACDDVLAGTTGDSICETEAPSPSWQPVPAPSASGRRD
jgi:Tol biopolymer transport system component